MKTPNPIDAKVGGRLRMRRLTLEMSLTKVGEALDVSFQQVRRYEDGTNRISASRLQQIADHLGVTPGYFFEDACPGTAAAAIPLGPNGEAKIAGLMSEGLQLSRAFAAVRDAKVRKRILDLIVSLARVAPLGDDMGRRLMKRCRSPS
jgi:transcriptional regulator with XRE-family HTH domain